MTHCLAPVEFDEFCGGAVSSDTIAALRKGQYSRRRLLLAALFEAVMARPGVCGPLADTESAWRTLLTVEEYAPHVVEDVLMRPSTGVWLARATRRLHSVERGGPPLWTELGFLHVLAAAAAVRARLSCAIDLAVPDDLLTLPTIGQVQFRNGLPTGFTPVRRHRAMGGGRLLDVEIDDCTPYRWFSAPATPDRLAGEELQGWREDLDSAWEVLTRWHPGFATELAAGLVSLAPAPRASRLIGSSASWAFGGVMVAKAGSPAALAATLVHEIQHSKLNALLDLVALHTCDDTVAMYAPWRDDPRPLTGLLHGVYAFTSTVEFWYTQRAQVPPSTRPTAEFTFVYRRMQVAAAIKDLNGVSGLSKFGVRLIDAAAQRLLRCPADDVPTSTTEDARSAIRRHRARWGGRPVE